MNLEKVYLKLIDEDFETLKECKTTNSSDIQPAINSLKKHINLMCHNMGIECEKVYITENNDKLFGMRVYPSIENSYEIMSKVVADKNKEGKPEFPKKMDMIIEIDSQVLWSKVYNFTPGEINAILLHEIGHVSFQSGFYDTFYETFLDAMNDNNLNPYSLKIDNNSIALSQLLLINTINNTSLKMRHKNNLDLEMYADRFVVDNGYGEELNKVLTKFNDMFKNTIVICKEKNVMKDEVNQFLKTLEMVKKRRAYVASMVDQEEKSTNSPFMKSLLKKIKANIKTVIKDNPFKSLNEAVLSDRDLYNGILNESFLFKLFGSPIKITQNDIDQIKIDIQLISDKDDKYYLVKKINKRLTQLDYAKEKLSDDKTKLSIIADYEKQLRKLLTEVINFKVKEKNPYGIWLKYPKGYEG